MTKSIAIVGAGIVGRLFALDCRRRGFDVTVFDDSGPDAERSCSYVAAAMLAPFSELEHAAPLIATLGMTSIGLWPEILDSLVEPVFFRQRGSLIVAHPEELPELERLRRRVREAGFDEEMKEWNRAKLAAEEPVLAERFPGAVSFPSEAQIDNRAALRALGATLNEEGATFKFGRRVDPHTLSPKFDWVGDCRGIAAEVPQLRGVRGEALLIHAPEVRLDRPVRLMHPRYPIYVVPRPQARFIVGATSIDVQDFSPISVRSTLELLSAAYSVFPGFAEGRVLETMTHCRPAFPDNLPSIRVEKNIVVINGLYRHGYLLAPALARTAADYLTGGTVPSAAVAIFKEVA